MNNDEGWYNFEQQNNDIDALIGPQTTVEPLESVETYQEEDRPVEKVRKPRKTEEEDDKLKHHRAAKYSDKQIEWLENIKVALGTTSDSDALRWALNTAYMEHCEKIESIAKKKERIGTLSTSPR